MKILQITCLFVCLFVVVVVLQRISREILFFQVKTVISSCYSLDDLHLWDLIRNGGEVELQQQRKNLTKKCAKYFCYVFLFCCFCVATLQFSDVPLLLLFPHSFHFAFQMQAGFSAFAFHCRLKYALCPYKTIIAYGYAVRRLWEKCFRSIKMSHLIATHSLLLQFLEFS